MKKITTFFAVIMLIASIQNAKAQEVIVTDDAGYTTPASGALLDVKSANKGFLPPRIALTSSADASTVPTPSTGLLVYNTASAGSMSNSDTVFPGYYYNAGTSGTPKWVSLMKSDGTNGMVFQNDGSILLIGTATNWDDFVVSPAVGKNSGGAVPGWSAFVDNIFAHKFEDTKTQSLDFSIQLPHSYKPGSTLYPHIHWSPMTAAGTTRVLWQITYQWVNYGAAYNGTTSTNITGYTLANEGSPARSLVQYESCITPIGAGITGTGMNISSILMCKLTRLGSNTVEDNYTGDAAILSIDFHYEVDSFGSKTQFAK